LEAIIIPCEDDDMIIYEEWQAYVDQLEEEREEWVNTIGCGD
jgi:hypothetical protein